MRALLTFALICSFTPVAVAQEGAETPADAEAPEGSESPAEPATDAEGGEPSDASSTGGGAIEDSSLDDSGGEPTEDSALSDSAAEDASTDDASASGAVEAEGALTDAEPGAAEDGTEVPDTAVEEENTNRALYAGIGMGSLGALGAVAGLGLAAGAAVLLFAPGIPPAQRTQGEPLIWFGAASALVGLVTTVAGGGLIGWSLFSDPAEGGISGSEAGPGLQQQQQQLR